MRYYIAADHVLRQVDAAAYQRAVADAQRTNTVGGRMTNDARGGVAVLWLADAWIVSRELLARYAALVPHFDRLREGDEVEIA